MLHGAADANRAIPTGTSPTPAPFNQHAAALLLEHMLNAATYCRVLFDGDQPVDFLHLYTNPAFRRHTGLEAEGRWGTELLPALRREDRLMLETCGRVARGGAPTQFCFFFSSVGAWSELSIFSPDADHVVVIFNVIKEQVRKAQTLRQREQWWKSTLTAMRDAVFVRDPGLNLVEMNDAFVRYHRFQHRAECLRAISQCGVMFEVRQEEDGPVLPRDEWPSGRALRGERDKDVLHHIRRLDTGEAWMK